MRSEDFYFCNIWQTEELRANVFDIVPELPWREPVCGEPIYDPESVAELVIEEGTHGARRQRVPDIADALAHVIPGVGYLVGRRASLEMTKIVVAPLVVKLRRKSRCGVSSSVRSSLSVI